VRVPLLWVIDPSTDEPEDEGVEQILEGWPGESRLFQPALRGDGPGPGSGYRADGLVVMGSRASVHDDLAWLARLSEWLRPILSGDVRRPLLGICFGHQLIAHLAGAEVGFVETSRRKLVGVEDSRQEGGRLLPAGTVLRVVVSHREEVKREPPEYRRTAFRQRSPIDGLEHESLPVWSFQFHPEARWDFARAAGIDPRAIDPRVVEDSRRLLGAFRRQVLESVRD